MEAEYLWNKIMSCPLVNPAAIENFLKPGTYLTVAVLSHVCGSRFSLMIPYAGKVSVLSPALAYWLLDRLCFGRFNDTLQENDGKKC